MLSGEYRIALLDVQRTIKPPILISAAWSITGGYRGEWFLIYPKMEHKLHEGRTDTGAGFDMQKTLDELHRMGMERAFNVERRYCEEKGIASQFQVPEAQAVLARDIVQHWLQGHVTKELKDVAQATNCPALKYDLLAIIGTPPVA